MNHVLAVMWRFDASARPAVDLKRRSVKWAAQLREEGLLLVWGWGSFADGPGAMAVLACANPSEATDLALACPLSRVSRPSIFEWKLGEEYPLGRSEGRSP